MEISCSQQCASAAALSVRSEVLPAELSLRCLLAFISERTSLPGNNRAVQSSSGYKMSELGMAFEKKTFAANTLFWGTCN